MLVQGAVLRHTSVTARRYNPRTMTTITRSPSLFLAGLLALVVVAGAGILAQPVKPKQAIAHRGASGYAPEHTPAAYKLAMEQKADFVEPDLAVSKDNVLFCMHDDTLERTTNIAEIFPSQCLPGCRVRTSEDGRFGKTSAMFVVRSSVSSCMQNSTLSFDTARSGSTKSAFCSIASL